MASYRRIMGDGGIKLNDIGKARDLIRENSQEYKLTTHDAGSAPSTHKQSAKRLNMLRREIDYI